ncbi:hypothetical protein [Thiocystis violacea]|nr:hypothetical protein [Thiocystis violacea]
MRNRHQAREKILAPHGSKRNLADGLMEGTGDGRRLRYEEMLTLVRDPG